MTSAPFSSIAGFDCTSWEERACFRVLPRAFKLHCWSNEGTSEYKPELRSSRNFLEHKQQNLSPQQWIFRKASMVDSQRAAECYLVLNGVRVITIHITYYTQHTHTTPHLSPHTSLLSYATMHAPPTPSQTSTTTTSTPTHPHTNDHCWSLTTIIILYWYIKQHHRNGSM